MSEHSQHGIKAGFIRADNVVSGIQHTGSDDASTLLAAAKALGVTNIDADTIEAINVVSGQQLTILTRPPSPDNLEHELSRLRTMLHEFETYEPNNFPQADLQDVRRSIEEASEEMTKEDRSPSRVLRKIGEARDIVTTSASTAEAAGTLTTRLSSLALQLAGLWTVVQQVFPI